MSILEEYDWMLINELSFKIHTISDQLEMRKTILERLCQIVPFDMASFYLLADWNNNYTYYDPVYCAFNENGCSL